MRATDLMRAIVKYLYIVLTHKWWVLYHAVQLGIPWLGIIHDLSKFHPAELFRYAKRWGKEEPTDEDKEQFKWAWLHHQRNNKHHWHWWVLYIATPAFPGMDERQVCLPIPDRYRREMVADWVAMGHNGRESALAWYKENRDRILLHPETREWVERRLGIDHTG